MRPVHNSQTTRLVLGLADQLPAGFPYLSSQDLSGSSEDLATMSVSKEVVDCFGFVVTLGGEEGVTECMGREELLSSSSEIVVTTLDGGKVPAFLGFDDMLGGGATVAS